MIRPSFGPAALEFIEVNEQRRTYVYPDDKRIIVDGVVSINVSNSGMHRINLKSGNKAIVAPGWRAILIEGAEWTF